MEEILAAATTMGPVALRVGDLDEMTRFYRDVVTLQVIDAPGVRSDEVALGRAGREIIRLRHEPRLRHAPAGAAGLFHTAILFESQAALAAALFSIARHAPQRFTGSADHLVSQAFYLDDPEGNGIELYWDRDRSEWSWTHGEVEMATVFLDPNAFLSEHLTESAAAGGTSDDSARIGHVHLSVGDIATAQDFYVRRMGFEATATYTPHALFVSAGGYHHHMAMNVWRSQGAGPRIPALGLGRVELALPDADALGSLRERLLHHGTAVRDDGKTLSFEDPWSNELHAEIG